MICLRLSGDGDQQPCTGKCRLTSWGRRLGAKRTGKIGCKLLEDVMIRAGGDGFVRAWDARESTRDADGAMDKWENNRGIGLSKWRERVYVCMRETALREEGRPHGARGRADLVLWSTKQTTMLGRKENMKKGKDYNCLLAHYCIEHAQKWQATSPAPQGLWRARERAMLVQE